MTTYSQRHEVTPTTGHRPKCVTFRALPMPVRSMTLTTDEQRENFDYIVSDACQINDFDHWRRNDGD